MGEASLVHFVQSLSMHECSIAALLLDLCPATSTYGLVSFFFHCYGSRNSLRQRRFPRFFQIFGWVTNLISFFQLEIILLNQITDTCTCYISAFFSRKLKSRKCSPTDYSSFEFPGRTFPTGNFPERFSAHSSLRLRQDRWVVHKGSVINCNSFSPDERKTETDAQSLNYICH